MDNLSGIGLSWLYPVTKMRLASHFRNRVFHVDVIDGLDTLYSMASMGWFGIALFHVGVIDELDTFYSMAPK